jgi:hypothetical protein
VLVCGKPFQALPAILDVEIHNKEPGTLPGRHANHRRAWGAELQADFRRVACGVMEAVLRHGPLVWPAGKDWQAHFLGQPNGALG